jgi:hypothetical protein
VRRLVALLVFLFASPLLAQTFVFNLSGEQEVPPIGTTSSGGCHGVLDQGAATFALTCVHDVEDATLMHIHRAPAGANGDVVFDLGDPADPVTATWTGMTPADIADLLDGKLYINVHSAGRPSGEVRGQILQRTVDLVEFTANGSQVVPPNGSPSTANCTADLNDPATAIAIQCTHNVVAPDSAHVHNAPFGVNGPAIFTFPSPASPLVASVPLTPEQVASFAATFLYLDIHRAGSGEEEEGAGDEIRGQIGTPPTGAVTGTIVIRKDTFPGGGNDFGFSETVTGGNFLLDDGQSQTFSGVVPGTYTVAENDPSGGGYSLADLACNDSDSDADTETRTATIRVAAGEIVTCTFRNFETAPGDDIFVFHLSGDQEVDEVATTERGGCYARFDSGASSLSLICTHDVELPTLMHIHRAPAGENGDVVFDLGEPVSPVIATWSEMTPANVADLFAGNLYINIHTSGRPAGMIRGQILERTVDTIAFDLEAEQVVPPGSSTATGDCTANLSTDATQLAVACTHDVPAPSGAHVHDAPAGENGPIVHTFASPASPIAENVPLTPRLVADFAAWFLYVDVHGTGGTEEDPADQIRGQIAEPPAPPTTGSIRIRKATSPADGTNFAFTSTIPGGGAFPLDDEEQVTFMNIAAGTYSVTESAIAGWSLTDIACDDNDSTGNAFSRTATVNLQPGELVTCTFHNLESVPSPELFVFHLSGSQEVPPNNSAARGGCFGQLNEAAATFSIVCTHNVVGPTLTHIHRAPAGQNGPVAFDLGMPESPVEATWTGMTPADIADLRAGRLYVNVHAGGRPDGEIRGQILPRTIDNFYFPVQASQEVPPTDSAATGNCFADLATDAASVYVQCTHNVDELTDIHLHAAPPGEDGPPIHHYPLTSPFAGTTALSPRFVADFAAGFLYVNIHSVNYEQGEIRGQLIPGAAPGDPDVAQIPTASTWGLMALALSLTFLAWRRLP